MEKSTKIAIGVGLASIVLGIGAIVLYKRNQKKKQIPTTTTTTTTNISEFPLVEGSRGELVVKLQKALGIDSDGIWGKKTTAALLSNGYSTVLDESKYNAIISINGINGLDNELIY